MDQAKPRPRNDKSLFNFIVDDFKSDIKFMRDVAEGKFEPQYTWKELLDIRPAIKKHWLFFLIVILAFFCGYYYAAQHYQDVCNQYIIENYIIPLKDKISLGVINETFPEY